MNETIAVLAPVNGKSTIHPDGEVNHLALEAFTASAFRERAPWNGLTTTQADSYTDILDGVDSGKYAYGIVPIGKDGTNMIEEVTNFWLRNIGGNPLNAHVMAEEPVLHRHGERPWVFHMVSSRLPPSTKQATMKTALVAVLSAKTGSPENISDILKVARATSVIFKPIHHRNGKPGTSALYIEFVSDVPRSALSYFWCRNVSKDIFFMGNFEKRTDGA